MRLAGAFAGAVVRARYAVIAAWVAAAVAATVLLPSLDEAQTGALGDLVPRNADALEAELRSQELFRFPLLSRTVVVQRDAGGLPARAQARVFTRALRINRDEFPGLERIGGALPVTNVLGAPPFARESSTTALTYLLFAPDVGRDEQVGLARRFASHIDRPGDALVGITGAVPARAAQTDRIQDALPLVELCTIAIVGLAVALHFRALAPPLVVLAAVGIAYLIAVRALAWAGERLGVSVPSEVQPVIVVLLFGIITDYAVFFLSRFRARVADGEAGRAAARRTTRDLSKIILYAGLTVAGGGAALIVARLGFLQAFGPGLAIAVLIGLAVAITFIPAALAVGGLGLFWPSRPGRELPVSAGAEETEDERRGRPVRSRALRLASEHPLMTALITAVLLIAAASGLKDMAVGQTLIRGLPPDAPARQAYAAASHGFAPGILSPTMVIAEARGITQRRRALVALQRRIARLPGVAQVVGPRQQPVGRNLGAVFSPTGNAVRYLVVFEADPLGARAIADLRRLRARLPALVRRAGLGGARTSIAGDTALAAETVDKTAGDLGRVAPLALGVVFLLLALLLRALVAPLYLVAASVLALAATLGLTVYVFCDLLGHGELTFYVPFCAAVLLVSLGSDYNVFLTGRVWQEARRRPLREAVAVGGSRAASAITVAGIVLALSFAALAIVPLRPFRELAFAMGVGLLVDAFLVRTLLVPAVISLVGPISLWPGSGGTPVPRAEDRIPETAEGTP